MTLHADPNTTEPGNAVHADRTKFGADSSTPAVGRRDVTAAANRAAQTIAPLWPLESFVAVNPFLGLAHMGYASADNRVDKIWGARLVMPRTFYAERLKTGDIGNEHIATALDELHEQLPADLGVETIRRLAATEEPVSSPAPTVAELVSRDSGRDWHAFVIDRISHWAAGYFDQGQASWRSPWQSLSPYLAWRAESELDRTPEIEGVRDYRRIVKSLPQDPDALLHRVATELGLNHEALDIYLQRLLATSAGWAGHARFQGWQQELAGGTDDRIKDLLAIRAAWDLTLLYAFDTQCPDLRETLRQRLTSPLHPDMVKSHLVNLVLHTAYEIAGRDGLIDALAAQSRDADDGVEDASRPAAQAVFCIDVRSERMRRALEKANSGIETLGFAGFFGFALEVAEIDATHGGAQCPVLLTPQFLVRESEPGATPAQNRQLAKNRSLGRRLSAAWKHFSAAAISSFAFVESLGLTYAWKLLSDSHGLGAKRLSRSLLPTADESTYPGRTAGISLEQRIEVAKGALSGMSLTDNFARVVALIGHGSTTTNNPYAARYHCGACGGHTGKANAIVAAQVLNDPQVRHALGGQGIAIPADTLFIAGLHDTATDAVELIVPGGMEASHQPDVAALESALAAAGRATRLERAQTFLSTPREAAEASLIRRSSDWSEVRPEWGLAGCMSFIAAPRSTTRQLNLDGRAFLHSYAADADEDGSILELIITAPLVVASWISLQYYASTVDNRVFGSGDKTLHNVVGGFGVLEGNGGDLRVGFPLQSLHDGEEFVHQPMRLNAFIQASTEAINRVLEAHDNVRTLVDNGWIHLFAIDGEANQIRRYRGDYRWELARPEHAAANSGGLQEPTRRSA